MRSGFLALLIVLALLVGGFFVFRGAREAQEPMKLSIVTTFLPLYVFTVNVVGDSAVVENLLPQGVGPHEYAFTPSDLVKIAEADVVVKHGRGIDDWLDESIAAVGRADLTVIVASEGIEPHTGAPRVSPEGNYTPPAPRMLLTKPDPSDPHIWLDPFLVVREVERIRDGLMAADPAHASQYARNAEEYLLKLLALDTDIRLKLANLSEREFVSFHPAFRYFAYEYELREVAVIEETPGEEPTPAELQRIVDDIRRAGVKVIFSEPQFSPKLVEILAQDYGLKLVELDPLETGELHPDYYEAVMRKNADAIADALK